MSSGEQEEADRPDDESTPIGPMQLALARGLRDAVPRTPGAAPFLQRWRFLQNNAPGRTRIFYHERLNCERAILMGNPIQLWSTYSSAYHKEVSIRALEIKWAEGGSRHPLALRIFRYGPGRGNSRACDLVLLQHLSWTCDNTTRCVVFSGQGRDEYRFPDYTVSLRDMPRGSRVLYVLSPDIVQEQVRGGAVFDPGCIGKPAALDRLRIIFSVPYNKRGPQAGNLHRAVGPG